MKSQCVTMSPSFEWWVSVCVLLTVMEGKLRAQPLEKIVWQQVEDSSNILEMFFDEPSATIAVRFKNGGVYTYLGATQEVFLNFLHAPSVGRYLHNVVKALPYTRWDSEEELLAHLNV